MGSENTDLFPIGEAAIHASPLTEGTKGIGAGLLGGAIVSLGRGFWLGLPVKSSLALVPSASLTAGGILGLFWTVRTSCARFRQTDDPFNTMAGGVSIGIVKGLLKRNFAKTAWGAIGWGIGLAAFEKMFLEVEKHSRKSIIEHEDEERSLWKFKGERQDPFERRWEDMKARYSEKNNTVVE